MKLVVNILVLSIVLISATSATNFALPVNAAENFQINKISTGKIAYDTFSASNGTVTDISWTYNPAWNETWFVENGKLRAGEGWAYPTDISITDGIWEVRTKPMVYVREGPEMRAQVIDPELSIDQLPRAVFDYYHIGLVY